MVRCFQAGTLDNMSRSSQLIFTILLKIPAQKMLHKFAFGIAQETIDTEKGLRISGESWQRDLQPDCHQTAVGVLTELVHDRL